MDTNAPNLDIGSLFNDYVKAPLMGMFGGHNAPQPLDPAHDPNSMKLTVGTAPNLITPNQNTAPVQQSAPMVAPSSPAGIPSYGQRPATPLPVVNNLGRNPDAVKKALSPQVKQAIEGAAKEFGVPTSLLYDIGYSEGGYRADAANSTPEGQAVGVPQGLFQFTPYSWDTVKQYAAAPNSTLKNFSNADRNDPVQNARAAAYLIKVGQLGRWQASKPNWERFYTEDELAPYYAQTQGYEKGKTFK